jgi:hypothetical protein
MTTVHILKHQDDESWRELGTITGKTPQSASRTARKLAKDWGYEEFFHRPWRFGYGNGQKATTAYLYIR